MADALWLADAIRGQGVGVVEVDGWQERGHGDPDYDAPRGVFVWHHTADGPNGIAPSLGIVINGASYTASGPLANLLQSREDGEGNDKAYVIAAGITYNSGFGGWNGIRDVNLHTVGLEIEHTGTQPLPRHRRDTACRIAAGCLLAMGYEDAHNACHHWEWSEPPGSKIDVCCEEDGQKCSGDDWRAQTTQIMQGGAPAPGPAPARREWNMPLLGHHFGDAGPGFNDDWYAIDGGLLVHLCGGERNIYGVPAEAQPFFDAGIPPTPLSDGDLEMIKARSGWK